MRDVHLHCHQIFIFFSQHHPILLSSNLNSSQHVVVPHTLFNIWGCIFIVMRSCTWPLQLLLDVSKSAMSLPNNSKNKSLLLSFPQDRARLTEPATLPIVFQIERSITFSDYWAEIFYMFKVCCVSNFWSRLLLSIRKKNIKQTWESHN